MFQALILVGLVAQGSSFLTGSSQRVLVIHFLLEQDLKCKLTAKMQQRKGQNQLIYEKFWLLTDPQNNSFWNVLTGTQD